MVAAPGTATAAADGIISRRAGRAVPPGGHEEQPSGPAAAQSGRSAASKTAPNPAPQAPPTATLAPGEVAPAQEQHTIYHSMDETTKKLGKPRVVVLGSGWGAMAFMKNLPSSIRCASSAPKS